jgi:hypothetical protein
MELRPGENTLGLFLLHRADVIEAATLRLALCSRAPAGRGDAADNHDRPTRRGPLPPPQVGKLTVAQAFLLVRRAIKKSRTCPRPD